MRHHLRCSVPGSDPLTDLPPFRLQPARSDLRGFQQLAELYQHALRVRGPNVDVDCTATLWFDANLAAALGAVGHALQSNETKKTLDSQTSSRGFKIFWPAMACLGK